jgi:hypothetical protein
MMLLGTFGGLVLLIEGIEPMVCGAVSVTCSTGTRPLAMACGQYLALITSR